MTNSHNRSQRTKTSSSPTSQATHITTPEQSPNNNNFSNDDDDIWESDSDHDVDFDLSTNPSASFNHHGETTPEVGQIGVGEIHNRSSISAGAAAAETTKMTNQDRNSKSRRGKKQPRIHSDLPVIKRQHMAEGYREGLATGKVQVMQKGFDDGYPIGIQIATRAGNILGMLDGYLAALVRPDTDNKADGSGGSKNRSHTATKSTRAMIESSSLEQEPPKEGQKEEKRNDAVASSIQKARRIPRNRKQNLIALLKLMDQASSELSCSALLHDMDDEAIYNMPSDRVPEEVETVLGKWETLLQPK